MRRSSEAPEDSPAVLIRGPHQRGKTTLARMEGKKRGYVRISLDNDVARDAAETVPVGSIADLPDRFVLDEV